MLDFVHVGIPSDPGSPKLSNEWSVSWNLNDLCVERFGDEGHPNHPLTFGEDIGSLGYWVRFMHFGKFFWYHFVARLVKPKQQLHSDEA